MPKARLAFLCTVSQVERFFEPDRLARLRELFDVGDPPEKGRLSTEEARALLGDSTVCVCSWGAPRFTKELLDAAPDLKLIVYAAGSVKPVATDEVYSRGITITSAAPAIAESVAETALGLIILSMKNVFALSHSTKQLGWNHDPGVKNRAKEMVGTTVGVVGAGHVGRRVLQHLSAFPVRVLLYDPMLEPKQATAMGAASVDLDTLMAESDVVSLHAPSIPATYHMINARRLSLLKDGATLINTARGSLIDEEALIRELSSGRIWACLDVTDPEPPRPDSPLYRLPNVVLTPHIAGGVTSGIMVRLGRYATEELERFAQGEPPLNPVRQEQLSYLA